jgi:hypothetical protein
MLKNPLQQITICNNHSIYHSEASAVIVVDKNIKKDIIINVIIFIKV